MNTQQANPYLQKPGESITAYSKRIIEMNKAKATPVSQSVKPVASPTTPGWTAYGPTGEPHTLSKGFSQSYFEDWAKAKGYFTSQEGLRTSAESQLAKAKEDLAKVQSQIANVKASPYGGEGEIPGDILNAESPEQAADLAYQNRIKELEAVAFNLPAETQEMKDKRAEIDKANEDYETALGTISDNPWLSEAGRVGRNKKLYDMYQIKATRLSEEYNAMADIQARTQDLQQAELNYLSGKGKSEEYLSMSDCKELGLPYGTTKREAMEKGIIPADMVKSWTEFSDSDKKKLAARGIDWTTEEGFAQGLQELYGAEGEEGGEVQRVSDLLTNFGTRDYVSEGYYNQVRATADMSATDFDRRFKYLLGGEVEGGIEFSYNDKKRLVASGLTSAEITQLQGDISRSGWSEALKEGSGLTAEQLATVNNIMKGVTLKEEKEIEEAKIRPSDSDLQKTAELLVARYWKEGALSSRSGERAKAIRDIEEVLEKNDDKIEINEKEYTLTAEEFAKFRSYMQAVTYQRVKEIRG